MDWIKRLFSSSEFIPHGFCYTWDPYVIWLNAASDALIALAYYTIPLTLVYFVRRRRDLAFHWIFLGFALFIVACGTTHVIELWSIWYPMYWLAGVIKAITAAVSVATAAALIPLVPQALALPSPETLRRANLALQEAQQALRKTNEELECRVAERTTSLAATNAALLAEIEERKRADERLRESELQLRTAIVKSPIPAIIYAEDGAIRFLSQGWTDYSGYTLEDIPTVREWGEKSDLANARIEEPFAISETDCNGEQVIRAKDGRERVWYVYTTPLGKDRSGTRLFLSQAVDLTERKKAETASRQVTIGQLAGGVAHDFNNLLSVIIGHIELLEMSLPLGEKAWESVTEIARAAERAAALTRQLLAFSRQQVLEPQVLDLNVVVATAEKMLRRLIGENVQLTTSLETNLSPVRADPGQIDQVLLNLAVNARDAMPKGGTLSFEIRNIELNPANHTAHPKLRLAHYVLLTISDTGSGMKPEIQARIFEPFFTTKQIGQGTGLGLSVVHGIVEQCGGHVEVHSVLRLGTTFKIYLPKAEEPTAMASKSVPFKPPHGRGETVLLVEDEAPVRAVTFLLLESLGYRVLEAANAEQALLLIQSGQEKVDLLLTDVIMPGKSGVELADALRSRDPRLKVLFQSGYTRDVVLRDGVVKAETAFLKKPFSLDALAKKLQEVLAPS